MSNSHSLKAGGRGSFTHLKVNFTEILKLKTILSIYYGSPITQMLSDATLCLLARCVDHRVRMTCAMILLCPNGSPNHRGLYLQPQIVKKCFFFIYLPPTLWPDHSAIAQWFY